MSKIWRVEEEQVMKAGKIIGTNYTVWYKDENGARTARRDYRHGHYKVIPITVLNFILDESNEAVTRYQEFDGCLYKRTMYKTAEQEQTEEQTAEATKTAQDATQAPTDAAELDSLKAVRDALKTTINPDTIRAALDAITARAPDTDPAELDSPRAIRAALTEIINSIYWDIAEDITPRTTTTA